MDIHQFEALWQQMRQELQDNDSSPYSEEARKWAVEKGLITGGGQAGYMWEDMMTREQMVTVLYRFAQLAGLLEEKKAGPGSPGSGLFIYARPHPAHFSSRALQIAAGFQKPSPI